MRPRDAAWLLRGGMGTPSAEADGQADIVATATLVEDDDGGGMQSFAQGSDWEEFQWQTGGDSSGGISPPSGPTGSSSGYDSSTSSGVEGGNHVDPYVAYDMNWMDSGSTPDEWDSESRASSTTEWDSVFLSDSDSEFLGATVWDSGSTTDSEMSHAEDLAYEDGMPPKDTSAAATAADTDVWSLPPLPGRGMDGDASWRAESAAAECTAAEQDVVWNPARAVPTPKQEQQRAQRRTPPPVRPRKKKLELDTAGVTDPDDGAPGTLLVPFSTHKTSGTLRLFKLHTCEGCVPKEFLRYKFTSRPRLSYTLSAPVSRLTSVACAFFGGKKSAAQCSIILGTVVGDRCVWQISEEALSVFGGNKGAVYFGVSGKSKGLVVKMQSDADLKAAAQVKADVKAAPAAAAQKRSGPDTPPELEGTGASASKRRATGPGASRAACSTAMAAAGLAVAACCVAVLWWLGSGGSTAGQQPTGRLLPGQWWETAPQALMGLAAIGYGWERVSRGLGAAVSGGPDSVMSCSDLPSCSGLPSSAVSVGTTFMFGGLDDSVDPRPTNELFKIAKNAFIGGCVNALSSPGWSNPFSIASH